MTVFHPEEYVSPLLDYFPEGPDDLHSCIIIKIKMDSMYEISEMISILSKSLD